MLSKRLRDKLETILDLPAMPDMISRLLRSLDNPDIRAGKLAELIEKDQSLTARVLKVANSPFYGFSRRISTVELAIIIMGLNSIKEIVISLIVQKLFSRRMPNLDNKAFWEYSLFCGSASRLIARRTGYNLAGEAFVAGLIHDLGILIINRFLPREAAEIWQTAKSRQIPLTEAEKYVLGDTHTEIGAWLAEKWRLPKHLCHAVAMHHTPHTEVEGESGVSQLTSIVSLAEWFAHEMGKATWSKDLPSPGFYLDGKVFAASTDGDNITAKAAMELLRQEIRDEFERASSFSETSGSYSLYKSDR